MNLIVDIEAEFDIEIEDKDIESEAFRALGGLINLIALKVKVRRLGDD